MGSPVTRYLLVTLLALACRGETARGPSRVLPAGQEALIAAMLGGRDALPGPCNLDRARVEAVRVVAVYRCAGAEAVLALHHPDAAPEGSVIAGSLAVFAPAPRREALVRAVVDRVRQRGGAVRWIVVEARAQADTPRHGELSARWLVAAAITLGVALAARRRAR